MRFFYSCLLLCFLIPCSLKAQEPVDTSIMSKIRQEAMTRSQVGSLAGQLTDEVGPRLTNSPGYDRAVTWAVDKLKSWGLSAQPESWGEFGRGWENQGSVIAMTSPYYHPLIAYPTAWTNGTNGPISAEVVLLDEIDSATINARAAELKGKIVMLRSGADSLVSAFEAFATRYKNAELDTLPDIDMDVRDSLVSQMKYYGMYLAAQQYLFTKGVVALLSTSRKSRDGTIAVQGSFAFLPKLPMPGTGIEVSREDYLRMQRLIGAKKKVVLNLDIKNKWYPEKTIGYNVVGEIKGSDPKLKEQVVMLGGHLDSWHTGTGATDNAAGCVVMMEAVRILKALGLQPKRTVRIALWGGEEQGLYGSFGYVKNHYGDPAGMKLKAEQKKVSVYFNVDNGSGKIRGVYLQHNDSARAIFNSWLQPFTGDSAVGLTPANTGSTDHISFDAVGIPGFQFIQDPLEYEPRTHHTNEDVYDHLQIEDLKQASMIVAAFVYNAAMRPAMIPRKPLPKPAPFVYDLNELF